ncbi:hypothetical protein RD792_015805 [Penstemon davidsonii]|uniref:Pectinesterase catalytic domain-containing protein n=1 Tax=Penstemon davidsonii TaxID=160366 RepID=A0ABR0CIB8_9LAMI|nr:hypothetical protein RD792_015805 [Penstemon davidsonii]
MAKAVIISCVVVVVVLAAIAFYFQHKNNSKPNGTTISNIPNFNAIVSKNKPDAYNTIMDAIASAPTYSEAKYFIHIEAGEYVERVEVWSNKTNIVIVGDGEATTKISWSRRYPDFATIDTATVGKNN